MSRANYLFTSESVSEGHPDKVCDQISDAILDAFIANDVKLGIADDSLVNTRLGCETLCTTNKIVIAGEGRGQAPLFHKHGDKARDQSRADRRDRARRGQGHRLRPGRLLVPRRRRRGAAARPVARHRHGRRRQEEEGRRAGRRRRPGHDVRLRLHRERGLREGLVHAGPDLLRPQDPQGAVGQAPQPASCSTCSPTPRARSPSNTSTASRSAAPRSWCRPSTTRRPATARSTRPAWCERPDRRRGRVGAAEGLDAEEGVRLPGQPDRQLRGRRTGRRLRPDRPQDHRRHLRRLRPARRRRLLRQGPDQGRPLGRLCGALSRQERGGRRPRRALHHPGRLCDRRRRSDVAAGRHPRHRQGRRGTSSQRCCRKSSRCGRPPSAAALKLNRPIYRRTAAYGHFGRAPDKDGGFSWEQTNLVSQLKSAFK